MITSCKQDKDCLTMNKEPPATPGLWLASSEKFVRLIERLQKSRSGIGEEVVYDCQKCGFTTRCCSTMTDHICKYHDNDTSIVETSVSKIKSTDNDFPAAQIANTAVSPLHNSSSGGGGGMVGIGLTNNHKESSVDSDGERVEEDDSDESVCEVNMLGSKHECKVCLQEFTRSERVREHYDAIHRNMVYVCSICNYTNRWKRSVIQHLRSKHGKSPPYKPLMIKKRAEGNENGNSKSTSGIPSSLSSHQSPSNNDFTPNGSSIGAEEEEEEEEIRDEKMEDDDDFGDDEEELGGNLEDDFDIADNDSDNNRFRPDDIEDDEYADLPEGSLGYRDDSATNNNNKLNQPNGFRSTHQRVVLACRKCGFSHKWRLILNNHLISAHDLKPPFDQYLIRKKIDSSLLEVDAKPRMQRFGNIDSKPMSFMDELNNPSSFGLKEQIRSLENLNSVLRMPFTNTKALPFASPMETQSYPCHRCSKSFDTMRGLKDHCEGMHSDMVWACKMCPFTDKWRPQAVSHLRNKHDCKPPYNDNLIRKRVTNQSPDSSNQPQHYEDMNTSFDHPSTSTCQLSMDNSDDLPLDLAKRDRYSSDEKLSPKDCFIHLPSDHYQCKLCSQNFSSVQGVTEHYEAFHLKMLYYCTLCNRSDIWRSMMTKHLKRKHHVEKPFDNYIKRLEIEPNMQHDHLDPSLPPSKPFIPRSPMPFDLTYPPQNGNTNRTTNRSPLIAKTQTPKIEDNNIGKHYIHVNNQLKCKICWSLFTSLQGFQEHYEAIHLDIIWTCRQCSHSFRWRQQLTKHLKLVHKCEPPFNEHMIKETGSHKLKKPIPEKSPHAAYSRRPSLPKSSRTSRTEPETAVPSASSFNSEQELAASPEQPQACSPESSVPDKSLSLKNYVFLNNQFSCKLCAAVFSSLQGFQEHHEAIHLSIVYACKLCGFENRWRPQVTTHLKRNHACEPPYGDYMYKRKSSKAGSLESASETSSKISEAGDGLAEDESYEMRLQVDVKDEDIESMEEQIEDDEENYLSLHGNDNCQEDDDEQRSQRCEDDDKKMTASSADRDNGNGGDDFDSEY